MNKIHQPEAVRFFIVAQEKGGAGKSFIAALLADTLLRSGVQPLIFSNDPPGLIAAYGEVQEIALASTEAALEDNHIDVDAHDVVREAIESLADDPTKAIIYDTGGSTVWRLSDIFKLSAFNDLLIECGVTAAVLVPVTVDTDVSVGALTTLAAMREALPDHLHFVVASPRDGKPDLLGDDHPHHSVLASDLNGVLKLPRLHRDMALLMTRIGQPIFDIADPAKRSMRKELAVSLGLKPNRLEVLSSNCATLLTDFAEELRPLVSWPRP